MGWTALLAAALLAWIAAAHPSLRMVDFIGFATRARHLTGGHDLVNPLYPVGYPALLVLGQRLAGDVLIAGKALSVLAGSGAVWAVSRWLSPWAGLWLLSSAAMLQWGTTEGTDMVAAALTLGGLLSVRQRPGLAGALLGAACLARYTAIAAVPIALIFARRRGMLAVLFAVSTAPHWATALLTGTSILPDQSGNLAIGGQHAPLLSRHTLHRIPHGLGRAVLAVIDGRGEGASAPPRLAELNPAMVLGGLGLLAGSVRRDWRAGALLLLAVLHLTGVGMVFVNPRLVLPASLCLLLGAAWLLPSWLLVPAALAGTAINLPAAQEPSVVASSLEKITAQCDELSGPILTSSPWFHQRKDGWLESGILLRRLGDSRRLDPATVHSRALAWQVPYLALDIGRVRASYPGLSLLARGKSVAGFVEVAKSPGWRVYRLEEIP